MKLILSLALVWLGSISSAQREMQFENEFVRVWKATIAPNEPLHYHRHDADAVIVGLKGGQLERINDSGEATMLTFEAEKACWMESDPLGVLHVDINRGDDEIVVMVIEIKSFNAPGFGHGINFAKLNE